MSPSSLENSTKALFAAAEKLNLSPKWLTKWGLLSVQIKGIERYLFMSKSTVNTQISSYLSLNKHATRTILERHGLPNIPYATPQSLGELQHFFDEHQPIVSKPTLGQRAQSVRLIKTASDLANIELKSNIFEKYIEGPEYRYLVLQGKVIAVQQKVFDGELYQPKNSRRISYPQAEWAPQLVDIALKATAALGLGFAAVDFKQNVQGENFVLEVNSAPALWRFESPDEGPAVPVSEMLLTAMIENA